MPKYDVVVVGSGCAGLTASLECALAGKKVLLIEQHNIPGGCATSFRRGRFEFEPSLHEMCGVGTPELPGSTRKIMDRYGVRVEWQQVEDCFRIISKFSDGSPMDVTMPAGVDNFINKMEEYVPGSRPSVTELFELLDEVDKGINYAGKDPNGADVKVLIQNYPNLLRVGIYNCKAVFDAMHIPQKAQDILYTYWSYLGVDMEKLSFVHYCCMVNNYIRLGAAIPTHTSHEISVAMVERLRELGGDVWFNCRAKRFLFRGNRCCGVETTMGTVEAELVFANINPDIIYGKMMPSDRIPLREKKLSAARNRQFGARMFTAYFGLNKTAEELGIHDYSIFLSGTCDSVKEYKSMERVDTNEFSIFLCYNIANPQASPEGTSMVSFTTMFHSTEDWDNLPMEQYVALKEKMTDKFLDTLKEKAGIDIRPYIEEVSIASPWTFAHYLGVPEGSVYGYLTQDWDDIISRSMMIDKDYAVPGLYPIGTSGIRGDGYSSAYQCGSLIAETALQRLAGGNA